MRCLNSPATLNALELQIVEGMPAPLKHVLVVNAGDGRLARALRDKLGANTALSVVTVQPGLARYVDDFEGAGSQPWDLAWHEGRMGKHGPYDAVVFYQFHEFWGGELAAFRRLLSWLQPGATVWASFVNAQSMRLAARYLPGARLGYSALADPTRTAASVDYASFVDFVTRCGGNVTQLWGVLEKEGQDYCQQRAGQATTWDLRGTKVKIGTVADAFLWGACITGIAFRISTEKKGAPRVSFSPYSAGLLQAILTPYPDEQSRDHVRCAAEFEVAAWRQAPVEKTSRITQLLLGQVGNLDRPREALVVGAGWGRDLLVMKRAVPAWEWTGVESDPWLLGLGEDLRATAKVKAVGTEPGGALPFADNSFDVAFSFGHFSSIYEPAARQLAAELRRVTRGRIHHLEDGRGPDQDIQLKLYSLKNVYSELGCEAALQPVLIDGKPNGMYFVNVASRD